MSCPAAGKHPGLICPLRQASLSPRDGRAKVLQPPPEPPRICRQTAITIPPDIGARYRQDLPYGSPAWHKCYATLRNTIEMVFTQLAKRAVRPVGGGREHVADLDVAVGDDDAVDEQLGQLPPLLEGGGGQAGADGLAECLDPVGDSAEFQPLPGGGIELALLGEQRVTAAVQVLALAV